MIAAISLMRRRDDVTLAAFRRHWLEVHGPLVCRFPALRHYVQEHVIKSPACNALARDLRIDGFPILTFDNDADRLRAHKSAEMAACNVDSRLFIGAVSRVICEPRVVVAGEGGRIKLIVLVTEQAAVVEEYAALPRVRGMVAYRVLQQGRAPNSVIPHLAVNVAAMAMVEFGSLVELEEAVERVDRSSAHFVVEEHVLAPTSP